MQSVILVVPVYKVVEFVGQIVQDSLPTAFLYVPNVHCLHVPPPGPVYPGRQRQLLDVFDPLTEFEFIAQARHVLTAVAPTAVEYVLL